MDRRVIERWAARFPFTNGLAVDDFDRIARVLHFPILEAQAIAYGQDDACPNYLMCIEGRTRGVKSSPAGREVLIYTVEDGGTCVLTTQCLLSHTNFPAESIAESRTLLAAVPASWFYTFMAEVPAFRDFVMTDYTRLLGSMFATIDTLAFATVEQRLARRLLADAGPAMVIAKTINNSPTMSGACARSSVVTSANPQILDAVGKTSLCVDMKCPGCDQGHGGLRDDVAFPFQTNREHSYAQSISIARGTALDDRRAVFRVRDDMFRAGEFRRRNRRRAEGHGGGDEICDGSDHDGLASRMAGNFWCETTSGSACR